MKGRKWIAAMAMALSLSVCGTGAVASANENYGAGSQVYLDGLEEDFVGASSTVKRPAKPVLTSVAVNDDEKLVLNWKKVKGARGYVIYRKSSRNGNYKKIKRITNGNRTRFIDTGVTGGVKYTYKIQCYTISKRKKVYSAYSSPKSRTAKGNSLYVGNYYKYFDNGRTEVYVKIYKYGGSYYADVSRNRSFGVTTIELEKSQGYYWGRSNDGIGIYVTSKSSNRIYVKFDGLEAFDGYYNK